MYIPVEVKCKLSQYELVRLIVDYKDMLVEVNGLREISTPPIKEHEKQILEKITLESVLRKLSESKALEDKKEMVYEKADGEGADKKKYDIALKIGLK